MYLLTRAEKRDIEQDTVLAVLEGVVKVRGSEKRLAQAAQINPVSLSYIRHRRSMLRIETAKKIAAVMPLSLGEQSAWIDHVIQYWQLRREEEMETRRALKDVPGVVLVEEVRHRHHRATFTTGDVGTAQAQHVHVCEAAMNLLRKLPLTQDPLNYLELAFVLQDTLSVLNQHVEAYWWARFIRTLVENLDLREYRPYHERLEFFQVNALHAEGIACHNLGLEEHALRWYKEAETRAARQQRENAWRVPLIRARLIAMAGLPRFSIKRAKALEFEAQKSLERRGDAHAPLSLFRLKEALGRTYVAHRNYEQAERLLESQYAMLHKVPHIGPLHQAIFLRTCTRLYWRMAGRESTEGHFFLKEAMRIASEAGLSHQLEAMRREFGVDESGERRNSVRDKPRGTRRVV